MPLTDELRELAECPDRFVDIADNGVVERFDDGRVCILYGPTFASVAAPSVDEAGVEQLLADVRTIATPEKRATWWIGPSARPPGLLERLKALGLVEPADGVPYVHALVATAEPPGPAPAIETRRVETFEDHVAASELRLDVFETPPDRRETERAHYAEYFAEAERTGIPTWFMATLDGRLAGSAGAVPSPRGVFLIGGATAPWARGRGVYRALVRARWDYAVARGTPALATHAQPSTSYPVLLHLGFEEVCRLERLEEPAPG